MLRAADAGLHSICVQKGHIVYGIYLRTRLARRQIDKTRIRWERNSSIKAQENVYKFPIIRDDLLILNARTNRNVMHSASHISAPIYVLRSPAHSEQRFVPR